MARQSQTNSDDFRRSVPLNCFVRLAKVAGVRLFSLQKGPGASSSASVTESCPIPDLGNLVESFADTAAVLQ